MCLFIYCCRLNGLAVGCPLCARERGRVYIYGNLNDVSHVIGCYGLYCMRWCSRKSSFTFKSPTPSLDHCPPPHSPTRPLLSNPQLPGSKTVITSPSFERGRFGLAVENIGDIDLDGLSDIAVSAPYEGRGRVYIYRGSESGVVPGDYQVCHVT